MPAYRAGRYCRECIYGDPLVQDVLGSCVHPKVPAANQSAGAGKAGGLDTPDCCYYRRKETCSNCRFFLHAARHNATDSSVDVEHGLCRRRAPADKASFPLMHRDCWCGEHEVKP